MINIYVWIASLIFSVLVTPLNIDALIYSIYQVESSGGINPARRFEPDFLEKYGERGLMPKLRRLYGDKAAASSYGNFQITLLKASEVMGIVSPEQLEDPKYNKLVAKTILNQYINKHGSYFISLNKIYTRWNGSKKYYKKAIKYYLEYLNTQ